jgi:hypothetical protein
MMMPAGKWKVMSLLGATLTAVYGCQTAFSHYHDQFESLSKGCDAGEYSDCAKLQKAQNLATACDAGGVVIWTDSASWLDGPACWELRNFLRTSTDNSGLVGWYLMAPPFSGRVPSIDDQAPVSKWKIVASFDTAKQCEDQLMFSHDQAKHDLFKASTPWEELATRDMARSVCIASDDPRLKGE